MPSHARQYAETIAKAHGPSGHATLPGGRLAYGAYRDDGYELVVDGQRLTDVDGDVTDPQWMAGRESILAQLDAGGAEQHDLVEVDPDTGEVSPILEDEFDNVHPLASPTDADRLAFVSTRDGSLDLYTTRIGDGEVTKRSTTDRMVWGFDWAPDGERLVYQAGLTEGSALRLVDTTEGRDEPLVDEPDSEQALSFGGGGHHAWSDDGIVFTTNHETGYREIAVADPDGDVALRFENERDKYDARWTPGGDVAFVEAQQGDHVLRILDGETPTTVSGTGVNGGVEVADDGVYYRHTDTTTAGEIRRDGETVVDEGSVNLETVAPEKVSYASFDDRQIPALLYAPGGDSTRGIVLAHGGPEGQHLNSLNPVTQALVQAGFTVLAADVRGSVGYGREFRKLSDGDLGGDDLQDLVAGAEYLEDRGCDSVGITGASYGGYMTLMGVGATDAFDAGVSVCGVVNWETIVENARGFVGDELMRKLGGTPEERPEFYEERSPVTYVDDVTVPLMVVQGGNDPRVPESEAEQIVSSLADRDVPHEYLYFENEGHGVVRTENRVEYVGRTAAFFETHL